MTDNLQAAVEDTKRRHIEAVRYYMGMGYDKNAAIEMQKKETCMTDNYWELMIEPYI